MVVEQNKTPSVGRCNTRASNRPWRSGPSGCRCIRNRPRELHRSSSTHRRNRTLLGPGSHSRRVMAAPSQPTSRDPRPPLLPSLSRHVDFSTLVYQPPLNRRNRTLSRPNSSKRSKKLSRMSADLRRPSLGFYATYPQGRRPCCATIPAAESAPPEIGCCLLLLKHDVLKITRPLARTFEPTASDSRRPDYLLSHDPVLLSSLSSARPSCRSSDSIPVLAPYTLPLPIHCLISFLLPDHGFPASHQPPLPHRSFTAPTDPHPAVHRSFRASERPSRVPPLRSPASRLGRDSEPTQRPPPRRPEPASSTSTASFDASCSDGRSRRVVVVAASWKR